MTDLTPTLSDLAIAAEDVLIDMRVGPWRAVETDHQPPGVVIVTLRRNADPVQCVCKDPEGDIDPTCAACLDGQPTPEYREVTVTIGEAVRG